MKLHKINLFLTPKLDLLLNQVWFKPKQSLKFEVQN